jgi:hypothetical protein
LNTFAILLCFLNSLIMATIVIMPKQGQSVESCIITEINKNTGDEVKAGDILFTYETDKASFEEVSPADGVVLKLFFNEGDEVPVLENMMVIGEAGEDISELVKKNEVVNPLSEDVNQIAESSTGNIILVNQNKETEAEYLSLNISPRARNLISREAVELKNITGSGPNGRIIEKDVLEYLSNRPKMTPLAKRLAADEGKQPVPDGTGLAGANRAAVNDGILFFGSWGNEFYALNVENGKPKWIWNNGHTNRMLSPAQVYPVITNGRVYLASPDRFMTVLDEKTGEVIWRYNDPDNRVRESIGVSEDGATVYAKTMDGNIIAIDATLPERRIKWVSSGENMGYELAPTALVEKDGVVYAPTDKGNIYAFAASDGKFLWKYRISNGLINMILPTDNRELYVSAMDGRLVKLRISR